LRREAAEPTDGIATLTNKTLQTIEKYNQASPANKGEILSELIDVSSQRKSLLLEEIEDDPTSFFNHVLPANIRDTLPQELRDKKLVEEETEVEGELTALIFDDFENNRSVIKYTVGEYNLHFVKKPLPLLTSSLVRARGIVLDSELVLESGEGSTESTEGYTLSVLSTAPTNTIGEQKTIVMLVNFINDPTEPVSKEDVERIMFADPGDQSVDDFYRENSFDQAWFSGNVYGWYQYYYSSDTYPCQYQSWAQFADSEAENRDGVDLTQYARKVYVFPNSGGCGLSGMGTLGGSPSKAWIFSPLSPRVYTHEIGHNFGVHHADLLRCDGVAIDDYANCDQIEYGDLYDIMGGRRSTTFAGYRGHFNVPHKVAVGWIPQSQIEVVTPETLSSDGIYTISPLEEESTETQAIKISKTDTQEDYYLEYRRPTGFDSGIPDRMTDGVGIHIWNGVVQEKTKLVDATPESPFSKDEALRDNISFYDSTNIIGVTQLGHDENSVTVKIRFEPIPIPPPPESLLEEWVPLTSLNNPIHSHSSVVANNYLYVIGGVWAGFPRPFVYAARVNNDGTIESWAELTDNSLPEALARGAAVTHGNTLFVVGGNSSGSESKVYTSQIQADGSLGEWLSAPPLPKRLRYLSAVNYGNYIYVVGGWDYMSRLAQSTVYSARIEGDGVLSEWVEIGNIPNPSEGHLTIVHNGYMFVIGGKDDSGPKSTVFSSEINGDGTLGAWSVLDPLPKPLFKSVAGVRNNRVFIVGGEDQYSTQSVVYSAEIEVGGLLGDWSVETPLPKGINLHTGVIYNDRFFIVGGVSEYDENYYLRDVYSARIKEPACVPESLLPGDLDCDCDVDIADIMKVVAIWNTEEGDDKFRSEFDFDDDGRISIADIMYIAAKSNTRCP